MTNKASIVRFEGRESTVIARMVRKTGKVNFWEEGMNPGTYQTIAISRYEDVPEKMRWFEDVSRFSDYKPPLGPGCAQCLTVMLAKP